jgi:hypothetical protein
MSEVSSCGWTYRVGRDGIAFARHSTGARLTRQSSSDIGLERVVIEFRGRQISQLIDRGQAIDLRKADRVALILVREVGNELTKRSSFGETE